MDKYLLITSDSVFNENSQSLADMFRPLVISQLSRLFQETEFIPVLILKAAPANNTRKDILQFLEKENLRFPHTLNTKHTSWRKLLPADLSQSVLITAAKEDLSFARRIGLPVVYFGTSKQKQSALDTTDWQRIYHFLRFEQRVVTIERKTSETDIFLRLNLDGQGKAKIRSPLGFLKHMLELFAKHSGFDIEAKIGGDTHVDEHHTVEDTAIVLGQAVRQAIGEKKGINRYGFLLPMDEARIEAAIDLSGRSFLTWKAKFKREKIGDVPTELFFHFFKSFVDHAHCTLYIRARGKNEHHIIEGIFKAVARSLRIAVQRDPVSTQIPSTKGVL